MGLEERRATAEFETNALPGFKSRIEEAIGFAPPIEVHRESISPAGESHLYHECWAQVYFEPLIGALKSVARDAIGKEALQAGLKKVVVQNTKGTHYADGWATMDGGTLTLDHEPLTNAQDVAPRTEALIRILEASL